MALDHTENRHADKSARLATDSWTVGIFPRDHRLVPGRTYRTESVRPAGDIDPDKVRPATSGIDVTDKPLVREPANEVRLPRYRISMFLQFLH